jgi:hypothetical protein
MWDLLKNILISSEFISTITGSLIAGAFTVFMFFLQNKEQKKFLEQQKREEEEKLKMQNEFQEKLLKTQNEFYQQTVETREKYERKRMLIGYLKEKIDNSLVINTELNNIIIKSKSKYKEAARTIDINAFIEWQTYIGKIQESIYETSSNIDAKRLNEQVDGKTYQEFLIEVINCLNNLSANARKIIKDKKQTDLDEGLKIYSQIDDLLQQSTLLLIREKNKMLDMLESIDVPKVDTI